MEKISLHRAQMKGDGLHLTNESANIIAEEVAIIIQTTMTQQGHNEEMENFEITIRNEQGNTNQNEELTTSEVNTTALIAAKIIGKGGERVKKIKGIYGVDINTIQTGDDDRTFTIFGKHQNVEKVAKIIKDIAQDTQEKVSEGNERSQYTNAHPEQRPKIPRDADSMPGESVQEGKSAYSYTTTAWRTSRCTLNLKLKGKKHENPPPNAQ